MGGIRVIAVVMLLLLAAPAWAVSYQFDAPEDRIGPASSFAGWSDTLARHQAERAAIQRCIADRDACSRRMRSVRHVLIRGSELERDDRVRLVNRYINRRNYRYDRSDRDADNEAAQWATLLEFVEHGGDCEDYAVAKYFMLRELDIPAVDLRVVVVWDRKTRGYHAVLAYRTEDGDSWMLDTDGRVHRYRTSRYYRFLFALNEKGVWDHALHSARNNRYLRRYL